MTIQNAKELPKVFYGLHMSEGVAEYSEPGKESYRILVNEQAIKQMDSTFAGRPVYVRHVDEVNLENIQVEADGYVVRSFYNSVDGKHWVQFIVVSDKGFNAIRNGWKLSNAYIPKKFAGGGLWHGVEYAKEVISGEYEHLAIVDNPRYAESIILTPEEFKSYCDNKEVELQKIANSKQKGDQTVLSLFKKQKVENAADFENTMVTLPNSKVDKTLSEVVEIADKFVNMHGYASPDHMVKVNDDEEMSVSNLVDCYGKMKSEMEEMKKKNAEIQDPGQKKAEEEDKSADKTKENEEKEEKKEVKKNHFESLKNAPSASLRNRRSSVDLDRVARGKSRYGSN